MTANEMADLMILFDSGRVYEHSQEIATMLRQQQAEIEALKDKCLKLLDLMIIKEGQPNKPLGDWWKGDPTCGGLTENYGLGKAQEK